MKSDFSNIKPKLKKKKPKAPPYQVPDWFKKLPQGSHGNTINQRKAWGVVSEFVRRRDFKLFGGACVDGCGNSVREWKEGQAGHWIAWGAANGIFKYNLLNLGLQSANCNRKSDGKTGHGFALELKRRHGKNILEILAKEDQKHRGEKIEDWVLVELAEDLLERIIYEKYG